MPYIDEEKRQKYDDVIDCLIKIASIDINPGDLNYIITRILSGVYDIGDPKYNKINTVVGILECAKLEFYRRVAAYEEQKMDKNGDVSEYEDFQGAMKANGL